MCRVNVLILGQSYRYAPIAENMTTELGNITQGCEQKRFGIAEVESYKEPNREQSIVVEEVQQREESSNGNGASVLNMKHYLEG